MSNTGLIVLFLVLSLATYLLVTQVYNTKPEDTKKTDTNATLAEGFQSTPRVPDGVLEEVIGENVTYPTARNPFMNVLIDEIKYNPTRPEAKSVMDPSVSVSLDQFFKTQFTNDPTDVFGKNQSQRQFYVTPSTTVPNDVDSYQNWLYRIPGKTCKEGGPCLVTGSEGGLIPWNNLSS